MSMTKKSKKKLSKGGKFKDLLKDDLQKRKTQGSQYGYLNLPRGVNLFKEEPGKIKLDILPYEVTDPKHPYKDMAELNDGLWYRRPFKIHRNVGPTNETIVCPTSSSKRCPICEYRDQRFKDGATSDELADTRPSQRNLYVVIPKGMKNFEEKPHIWDISQYLFENRLEEELNEDEDKLRFPQLEGGLTLRIRFKEKSLGKNNFSEATRVDFLEREKDYDEDTLKEVPKLDEVLTILPYNTIRDKFFEIESEVVDDEEEEEEGKTKKKSKALREDPKFKDEDEDKDDEDEDEETDDEDDEDEDEETDDDEDDEDDEEKPKRKSKNVEKQKPKKKEEKPKKNSKSGNKCPHGHKFGKDCEDYDECVDCEIWDECYDAKEGM